VSKHPLRDPRHPISWLFWLGIGGALVAVTVSVFDLVELGLEGPGSSEISGSFRNEPVQGRFRSTNDAVGTWDLAPQECVAGRERGFEGIAFVFGAGDPVEEIRLDTARQGDNVVEVRLADREGPVHRVREAECDEIGGRIDRTNVELNGRHMLRLEGNVRFDCPEHSLSGRASFSGCLPETL